jgi:serine protease inhibitor
MTVRQHSTSAVVAAVAATVLLVAGCGTARPPAPVRPASGPLRGVADTEPVVSPRPFAAADLAFGLNLLAAWCRSDPSVNIVLSPSSLASGLGMAYLGARGGTAAAMAAALHLPSAGSLAAGLQARSRALAALDRPGVTVDTADRVWSDPALAPLHSYLNAVATGYGASIGRVPILTAPGRAAAQINATVAAATGGHITRLLSAQAVSQSVFVLTDAVYLRAKWAQPFDRPARGPSEQFSTAAGGQVRATFLRGGDFSSATAGGWTAVALPYQGGTLAMTALLPPASAPLASCPQPTVAQLAALHRGLTGSQHPASGSAVALPELSLRDQANLKGLLTGLGMGVAFGPAANFTGLSPVAAAIGEVEHAATLRVDAGGTVASAATAVTILPTAIELPRRTVVFSRPFLLMISAAATGEPLFLARVANPDLP